MSMDNVAAHSSGRYGLVLAAFSVLELEARARGAAGRLVFFFPHAWGRCCCAKQAQAATPVPVALRNPPPSRGVGAAASAGGEREKGGCPRLASLRARRHVAHAFHRGVRGRGERVRAGQSLRRGWRRQPVCGAPLSPRGAKTPAQQLSCCARPLPAARPAPRPLFSAPASSALERLPGDGGMRGVLER